MTNTKTMAVLIVVLLIGASISTAILISFFSSNHSSNTIPSIPPYSPQVTNTVNPLIEGVSYVGQETGFFCHYAACTMIFQYLGRDANLNEVLYYSGVGYSQVHQDSIPLPIGSYLTSQLDADVEFLTDIYGLSSTTWIPDSLFDNECWMQYWFYVRQNISNSNPIITGVDPFLLPSVQKQFDVSEHVWDSLQSGSGHAIVVVGYNESNETVCFNDPVAQYYGNARLGTYAWMSLDDFKDAVSGTTGTKYFIRSFQNISSPLPKDEAFARAHERNIERLKGNNAVYDSLLTESDTLDFGIEASKGLNDDFAKGIKHRIKTIFLYKKIGMQLRRQNRRTTLSCFLKRIPRSFIQNFISEEHNFGYIAIEKRYTADYLSTIYLPGYSHEAALFEQEADYWDSLDSYLDIFLRRGFCITSLRSILIIRTMYTLVDDIISTEEAIITGSST